MGTGAITEYVDVAQVVLYVFWAFFAGLILYLVRENHREGYPVTDARGGQRGWPLAPVKTYLLADGTRVDVPRADDPQPPLNATVLQGHAGSPLDPDGDPMTAGVGPGAYALRADTVELTFDGQPKIVPLRTVSDHALSARDTDPRGLPVMGGDREEAGTVVDVWIDLSEVMVRFLEVRLADPAATRTVLVPMPFARVRRFRVDVPAIYAAQFAQVPVTRDPAKVTLLEEERIAAYYGAGTLYADPRRTESLL